MSFTLNGVSCSNLFTSIIDFFVMLLTLFFSCGPSYHILCDYSITPWLTERSGSCPLCKQLVIADDKDDENSTGGDEDQPAN